MRAIVSCHPTNRGCDHESGGTYLATASIFLLWRFFASTAMPITLRLLTTNFEEK